MDKEMTAQIVRVHRARHTGKYSRCYVDNDDTAPHRAQEGARGRCSPLQCVVDEGARIVCRRRTHRSMPPCS